MFNFLFDTCILSERNFQDLFDVVWGDRRFHLVNCNLEKIVLEREKRLKLLQIMKSFSDVGRVCELPSVELKDSEEVVCANKKFTDLTCCDDPHIFAISHVLQGKFYVFSTDRRMCKCRSEVRKALGRSYTGFTVLKTKRHVASLIRHARL